MDLKILLRIFSKHLQIFQMVKISSIRIIIRSVQNNSKIHSWIWHDYERILSQLNPKKYFFDSKEDLLKREGLPNSPYMELFYIKNRFFMEDNEIVNNISKINNVPSYIVQGRYDLICPPLNAYNLHKKWKSSKNKICKYSWTLFIRSRNYRKPYHWIARIN